MNDSTPKDGIQDRIQRILNDYKRQEISERYDAQFHYPEGDSELPSEVDSQWLNYIEEFERLHEEAARILIRERVGNPSVRYLADLHPAEVEAELYKLLNLLAENGIVIDFIYDVEITEVYRFITEEFLDKDFDDIRIPGMYTHFTYEDYHPNDVEEVKDWAEDFLRTFFHNQPEFLDYTISDNDLLDTYGDPISPIQMQALMAEFHAKHGDISNFISEPLSSEVEGDYAFVEFALSLESRLQDLEEVVKTTGRAKVRLMRSPYSGWDVIQAKFPDLY